MSQESSYKFIRAACIGLGFIAATMYAVVTVIAERTDSTPAVSVAMPGLMCHLLITGGHGGSHTEEVAGFIVAVSVNAILAASFFAFVLAIFRYLHRRTGPLARP